VAMQVRPSGWVRRILWVVALSAMAGSFLGLVILGLVYSLTSSARSRPKGTSKEMKGSGSDEEVSSEEGASDQATGVRRPHSSFSLCCLSESRRPLSLEARQVE
jgi:hypothetical protein